MKKQDAMDSLERAGATINETNARIWATALNPTQYGWVSSIASIAAIPVLSTASLGHMVGSAVVSQISPSVFDSLSKLSGGKDGDSSKG